VGGGIKKLTDSINMTGNTYSSQWMNFVDLKSHQRDTTQSSPLLAKACEECEYGKMVNYGYGPETKRWDESKKHILARSLRQMVDQMKKNGRS
jgi:hypothetical protein